MTEPITSQHNPQHAANEAESNANEQTPVEPVDVETLTQQATEAREQAEQYKTRGDHFYQALHVATMQQATGDLLHAISDMPDDDERYRDEAGFPSLTGMREVAEELVSQKPYLAKVRGDIRQAPQQAAPEPTWSDILRSAVS